MKTYEETIRAVFDGRDEMLKKQQKKNKILKGTLIPLACSFAVILLGVGIWRSGVLQKAPPTLPTEPGIQTTLPAISQDETTDQLSPTLEQTPESVPSGAGGASEVPSSQGYSVSVPSEQPQQNTAPVTTPAVLPETTDVPDGDNFGGPSGGGIGTGYFAIPVIPFNREIVTTGEKITDEEAAAYFAERKGSLAQSLSASGVAADNIRISEKGYCHACYYGMEGERLEVRENFRDYLVYNGETLIAIVTLYKENGQLFDTPAFGAPWFSDYAAFLRQHRGEDLVYVYAGFAEIILTPDGGMYSALSGIIPEYYMEGTQDPYHVFYHPSDVYTP